jgi:magnesium transporter
MMFPTLMASLFGMNLINGMEKAWWGFPVAIVLTIIITLLFWWFFRHKKWI